MDFTLLQNASPDNAINKVLSGETTINIFLKRDVDISSPEIVLKTVSGIDFRAFNYASIPALGRLYFIRSIDNLNNEVFRLNLECDVIETYKAEILACNAKYQRHIAAGDYGETSLSYTGEVEVTEYQSDISLTPSDNAILNVFRWK
ncbi:MAG: hypothetical protein ACK5MR_15775 [Cumulibacter sp.]